MTDSLSPVNRRLGLVPALLTATALFAIGGLSACDEYQANGDAAVVNGHKLSLDQLDDLAKGDKDPATRRAALSAWIQVVAASTNPGELLTEADLSAERDLIIPPLIESTREQAKAAYEQGMQGSPLLCLAVIPLAADVPSATLLDALDAGIPFAELAAQFSEDPSLVDTGGVIVVDGQECLPTDQWNQGVLDQLTSERITVGEVGVISLNDAEVIVLLRPYDELTDASKSALSQGPVSEALASLYRAAEVTVHDSIGVWDAEQGLVVAAPNG